MARLVLEQLSDFGDYTGSNELTDIFKATDNEPKTPLSNVRLSPEGRHVHIIQRKPHVGLVTLDQHERPQLIHNQKRQDLCPTRAAPIVDVLYLAAATAAVIYEDGKAEFWRFQPCKGGWRLLQTSDLCNSPRARVVSVCASGTLVVWCEERPPSESSPALGSARNKLRYCVCRREVEVEEAAVVLGGVKITLHNNPRFTLVGSGERVHLLPDLRARPLRSISGFLLSWSPRHDSFTVSTACKNTPLKTAKESDFKRLVVDCLGYLSTRDPPEIRNFSPTACGGLLLLFSTGWVCHLQRDGVLRKVYKAAGSDSLTPGARTDLRLYRDTLALLMEKTLRLVDVKNGKELETISLKKEGLLYVNQAKKCTPHLFTPTGLFAVVSKEAEANDCNPKTKHSNWGAAEHVHSGALLVEAVFEEACKYYQQRSLSRTQLTVDALKRGGRFQAPIALASILRDYVNTGSSRQREAEDKGQDKLTASVEVELKALACLEELKARLVGGGVAEVEAVCESLVEMEVARVLSSPELDVDALLHLNSVFRLFPGQAWRAAQLALRLHRNSEGALSSKAPPDVWKTVLSPADVPNNRRAEPDAAVPVFELLCHSLLRFQPSWLPGFLALAQQQQQQGSASLGLSVTSSSSSSSSSSASSWSGTPLYKRALAVLSRDKAQHQDLEVELLLVSGRPNAILQAMRVLMAKQRWEKVTRVAQEFCKQSPLLNKEIFTTLLCEVAQHRDLDPYLDLLWALCPEDLTVTAILNLVLKNLSSPNNSPSSPSASSFALYSVGPSQPAPFADPRGGQLTIGLLKPLLRRVLQREAKPSQHYADILQSPSFPPPAPPRQPAAEPGSDRLVSSSPPCNNVSALLLAEQQPSTLSADPV
ncbi:BLOC-2 complex member HPS6 [Nelusetta ayraudi]|uniref:BLOC-2 complex member HPS6 n=1 Tax=Nelusetta ayraudi TaxID=303726 RepID=UPI003F71FABD